MELQTLLQQFEFFTGVPDSALRPLCDFLIKHKGISAEHIIAANEGNCAGLAAGVYLATGKAPVVYLQNSGIGNIINPVASLLNEAIYGIPCVFFVGWRGEPGTKDEPQHVLQGQITCQLLENVEITPFVISRDTTEQALQTILRQVSALLASGKQAAFVFRRDALPTAEKLDYTNSHSLRRETALEMITQASGPDILVSSTGKISRELFEIRERAKEPHCRDFLTVGSMGHTSSIALGIALKKPAARVWCLEGDGSFLMHMGAAAVIGSAQPENMVHVVLNNEAHESVGGMPTVAAVTDLCGVASACGYEAVYRTDSAEKLQTLLGQIRAEQKLTFLEIKIAIGSRADLGRPTVSPQQNRVEFMQYLDTLGERNG